MFGAYKACGLRQPFDAGQTGGACSGVALEGGLGHDAQGLGPRGVQQPVQLPDLLGEVLCPGHAAADRPGVTFERSTFFFYPFLI